MSVHEILSRLTPEDRDMARGIVGGAARLWNPNLAVSPEPSLGPYLLRWYLVPRAARRGSVMFHIQAQSDPEQPFHDHPWDNFSVILAGGYIERIQPLPPFGVVEEHVRRPGDTIVRAATEAHRLILPPETPYSMSLFSTGPKIRNWGFWYGDTWHHYKRHVEVRGGVSVHVNREEQP